jgi:hypothetical protein
MMSGDFQLLLKRLNPKLKIWSNPNNDNLASIYYVKNSIEFCPVIGIDKNFIPEYSIYDKQGYIIKGGWSRVINHLYRLKLTTREKIKKELPSFFERRIINTVPQIEEDEAKKKLRDLGFDDLHQSFDPEERTPTSVRNISRRGSYQEC